MKLLLKILLTVGVLGCCTADTVVMNQLMDQVIDSMKMIINQAGMNELNIPDMNNDWHYRWHFVKLSGHAKCNDGKARALASLKRTGDTTLSTNGNRAVLTVRLGLDELAFEFKRCQFKAKHLFSVSSHIKAKVKSNSILLQISLTGQGPQCVAALEQVVMDQFGGIDINTGGGIIHKIENKIMDWAANHFRHKILNIINEKLADSVRKSIPKLDLCSRIPH